MVVWLSLDYPPRLVRVTQDDSMGVKGNGGGKKREEGLKGGKRWKKEDQPGWKKKVQGRSVGSMV